MLEPLKHEKVWMKTIEQYLNKYYWEAASFYQIFQLSDKGEILSLIDGFEVYPVTEQLEIIGLLASNGKGLTLVHFVDLRVKTKYNVLKTLISLKTSCLKGDLFSVDLAKQILEKSLNEAHDEVYHWMALEETRLEMISSEGLSKKIAKYEAKDINLCLAHQIDFQQMVPFLIEVEKTFNRNPLSVNQLKKKMNERSSLDAYLLAVCHNQVIGQGLLEYSLPKHRLIGGIYVAENYRNKGIGNLITHGVCQILLEKNILPALTVETSNQNAIALYTHSGFQIVGNLKTSYIKMRI